MKFSSRLLAGVALSAAVFAGGCVTSPGRAGTVSPATTSAPTAGWSFSSTPVWQDEFDGTGKPDPARWGYDLGGHGWGNRELQTYTDSIDNAFVGNGVLTLVANKDDALGYTSARLITKGKGDFRYGRIEVRAKLPARRGTWPAIWMKPTDGVYGGWPKSGEIDIMEHVGHDPGRIHVSVHTQTYNHIIHTQKTNTTQVEDPNLQFHRYRVDWTPDAIDGYVDDVHVFKFANEGAGSATWPFDQRFFLLLNIAVGGFWGGIEGVDAAAFPARMEVDYVRVYGLIHR